MFKEFCIMFGSALAFIIFFIWVTDKSFGLRVKHEEYKTRCESQGGIVYKPRDEPKRCMKKEFFIDMGK